MAASAGNSGPTTSTVAHPSPWITTVAAGTHNRNGTASVTLGNGATYTGASVATPVGPAPLIDAVAAGLPGADPEAVRLCFSSEDNGSPVLDPAKVAGKIVVCDRGVTARVNKSLAVQEAGGVGMVLVNTSTNSLNADFHFVPTVHLQNTDRAAVKAYAATAGATATIGKATIGYTEPAPFTASFSSRGPLRAGGGDLLKPDVIAPGQDILAAVAPPNNAGRDFDLYSGTSMSSPHVAGLAALLSDLHPQWSPMAIKSALMTSAYDVLDGGTPAPNTNPVLIFRQGAGHVQPNSAADPGLVYDSSFNDWLAFICATAAGRRLHRGGPDRSERPEHGVHRHRRPGRRADSDPQGHQRQRQAADHDRRCQRAGRLHHGGESRDAHTGPGGDEAVHGQDDPDHGGAERLHRRPAHLDRWRVQRSQPDRGSPGGPRRPGRGQRQLQGDLRLRRPVHRNTARTRPAALTPGPWPTTPPTAPAI